MSPTTPPEEPRLPIEKRIADVRDLVHGAVRTAGRKPDSVQIIAVSKTRTADEVRAAADAGLTHFGENYLQDALQKIQSLQDLDAAWHFIGRIQSNKTREIARWFDWVHTVDRLKVAQRLSEQREGAPLNVLLQVNIDGDAAKGGIQAEALPELADQVAELPNLRLRGLMCILAQDTDPDAGYARMKALFDAQDRGADWDSLSMGMSGDYEHAIRQGATLVRIGTAIFGPRNLK